MSIEQVIASAAVDVVAVYTQDYTQVFRNARPIKVTPKPSAKLMEHPVETGATITDNRIIEPVELELAMILPSPAYKNTYQDIKQLFLDATLLIVQTKADTFENMLIQEMPHQEDAEMYDALPVALKLKEVLFVTSRFEPVPRDPANTSTRNRGTQQSAPASDADTKKGSVLFDIVN